MLTLNQIKTILTDWFNNHAQINSTYYCDDFDFNAERNIAYPVTNIEYLDTNVKDKETTHTFKIALADLVDQNISGHEDEIQSDMLMIAEDFFAWAQYFEGFNFQKSVNIQKFLDDADDRTSGIVFKIQLTVIRSQNTCQIPYKLSPTGSVVIPTFPSVANCDDYVKFNRQTGDYTLQLTDVNKMIQMDVPVENVLTIPNHSSVPFKKGTVIIFSQYGIGHTTIFAEAGVITQSPGNANHTYIQYSVGAMIQVEINIWHLFGDIE